MDKSPYEPVIIVAYVIFVKTKLHFALQYLKHVVWKADFRLKFIRCVSYINQRTVVSFLYERPMRLNGFLASSDSAFIFTIVLVQIVYSSLNMYTP